MDSIIAIGSSALSEDIGYVFRSGNYYISKKGDKLILKSFALKNSKCKHGDHFIGKVYSNSFYGLEESISNCICIAAKSLRRDSGELIYNSAHDPKRLPKIVYQSDEGRDEELVQVEIEYLEEILEE